MLRMWDIQRMPISIRAFYVAVLVAGHAVLACGGRVQSDRPGLAGNPAEADSDISLNVGSTSLGVDVNGLHSFNDDTTTC